MLYPSNIAFVFVVVSGLLLRVSASHAGASPKFAETVIYNFCSQSGCSDGAYPHAPPIVDGKGNLYGTTYLGGLKNCGSDTCGTIYKVAPTGTETVLYRFCSQQNCADGTAPLGGLIKDAHGNLYGTTEFGGSGTGCSTFFAGCGVAFRFASDGTETVLHSFSGGNDGAEPQAALVADKSGNLYGTTFMGGANKQCSSCGTVFRIAPDGTEVILHAFTGGGDGEDPVGDLVLDANGTLYGTTEYGGGANENKGQGCGTVFKVMSDGAEIVLYAFQCGSDGNSPQGSVVLDDTGNIFGTTQFGGGTGCDGNGCGTLFEIAADGTEFILTTFDGGTNGSQPFGGLIRRAGGNIFGTTMSGGAYSSGEVFRLAPNGKVSVIYSFAGPTNDGQYPYCGLFERGGNMYGTTTFGGSNFQGMVFELVK